MAERVLVLGAGASLGARAGHRALTNCELPPLGGQLARYLLQWVEANDPHRLIRPEPSFHFPGNRLCANYTGDELWRNGLLGEVRTALADVAAQERNHSGPGTPFEVLMRAWSTPKAAGRLRVLNRLLVYAMNFGNRCAFTEGRDRYDDLLARFRPTLVVTVNYDTLVEDALLRRSCRYSYPELLGPRAPEGPSIEIVSSPEGGDIVPMFKLHGSVNWHSIHDATTSADIEVVERISAARATQIVQSGPFTVGQTWASYASANRISLLYELEQAVETGEPIIAVYGPGKYIIDNPVHVDQHRSGCLARLRSASVDRVLAIGIRPVVKADDPVVSDLFELLSAIDGERTYVSLSSDDCEAMRARGFQPMLGTLADYMWLDVDAPVTVVDRGRLRRARVRAADRDQREFRVPAILPGCLDLEFRAADEGSTWCRGHKGEAVDALSAAAVME